MPRSDLLLDSLEGIKMPEIRTMPRSDLPFVIVGAAS